ncbi:unnamed protein product [Nippostrongylus brasiliensis]|uniref:Uncharacterized protein n=1 Tax=Nippostrongylus brasiliensis TaxID=27835 RepID=A0A0N4YC95_NIPBR|nr:unnamed protein product [Nippostrongylus brasiliensis]
MASQIWATYLFSAVGVGREVAMLWVRLLPMADELRALVLSVELRLEPNVGHRLEPNETGKLDNSEGEAAFKEKKKIGHIGLPGHSMKKRSSQGMNAHHGSFSMLDYNGEISSSIRPGAKKRALRMRHEPDFHSLCGVRMGVYSTQ